VGADAILSDRLTNVHGEANIPFSQVFCERAVRLHFSTQYDYAFHMIQTANSSNQLISVMTISFTVTQEVFLC
jgi:hypothetical protein